MSESVSGYRATTMCAIGGNERGQSALRKRVRQALRGVPVVSGILVLLIILAGTLGPLVFPGAEQSSFANALKPPVWIEGGSWMFPLGTDPLGRDQLARLAAGARLSLIVAFFAIGLAGTIGILLGLASGYVGGFVDTFIMRTVDAFLAMPFVLMALGFIAAVGPGMTNIIIVMGITNWARYARLVRGEVLSVKRRDFVDLARVAGVPSWRIALRHILPNVINSIVVLGTLDLGRVILMEASLSFLGLGVQPPEISWGMMIADGRLYMTTAWWLTVFPGLAIMLTVLSFNTVGDWIRDRLDPRQEVR